MLRTMRAHLISPFLVLGTLEAGLFFVAVNIGLIASYADVDTVVQVTPFLPQTLFFVATIMVLAFALGLYNRQFGVVFADLLTRIIVTSALTFFVLSFFYYLFPQLSLWRSAFAVAFPISFFGWIGLRWYFLSFYRSDVIKRRILVIGTGEKAARIERREALNGTASFVCIGFVTVPPEDRRIPESRILSGAHSLLEIVREHRVDEVVIALAERRGTLPMNDLVDCRLAGIPIESYQAFWERETGKVDIDDLRADWFLFSGGFPGGRIQYLLKRGLDILTSAFLLALAWPIMAAAAIAIRFEDGGPVLYRQARIGVAGHPFRLMKFRSMRTDAEADGVARWAQNNDERVTAVGSVIRKLRIDELPQLFNILKGDMSFVGPRPERAEFVQALSSRWPFYFQRHSVKPGLTGWAQINFRYGSSMEDSKEKLSYDLYYVKHFSIIFDVLIMLQTLRVVIWTQGAR
jgi:sugar transferase (PEP-CTERM system associated)